MKALRVAVKPALTGKRITLVSLIALVIAGVAGYAIVTNEPKAHAVTKDQWNAGFIIGDDLFYNQNGLNVNEIQSFMNSKVPTCDTNGTAPATEYGSSLTHAQYAASKGWQGPPYSCLKDYKQDIPQTEAASGYCNAIPAGTAVPSAQIVYNVAQACHINPAVLLVMLQKEEAIVLDTWPTNNQYKTALGYGCPDTAACDSKYFGFYNQLYNAAKQFQIYKKYPNDYSYVAGRNNNIYYSPNFSCGSSSVYIQNQATAGLYNYTPYQPNQSALDNLYGSGDSCGAYGNRNFWRLFNDWFGNTQIYSVGSHVQPAYSQNVIGNATSAEICGIKDNGCYQIFEGGTIYWSAATGAHKLNGGIRNKWNAAGSEYSVLGFPTSDELYGNKDGGAYQIFQGGRIYYLNTGQAYVVQNPVYDKWNTSGGDWGTLGNPRSDSTCGLSAGGCYQVFTGGSIYWTSATGGHTIAGGIRAKWGAGGSEWGLLGYPTSDEQYGNKGGGAYQLFQNGRIYYTGTGASYVVESDIYTKWSALNAEWGSLGYPKTDSICGIKNGGCYQLFSDGRSVYWSTASGGHTIGGGIRSLWASTGSEWGSLGYPIGDEQYDANGAYQIFQGGRINWPFNAPSSIVYG